jgi:hypothetical protein
MQQRPSASMPTNNENTNAWIKRMRFVISKSSPKHNQNHYLQQCVQQSLFPCEIPSISQITYAQASLPDKVLPKLANSDMQKYMKTQTSLQQKLVQQNYNKIQVAEVNLQTPQATIA